MNDERGTRNDERGTTNEERGTTNEERGTTNDGISARYEAERQVHPRGLFGAPTIEFVVPSAEFAFVTPSSEFALLARRATLRGRRSLI